MNILSLCDYLSELLHPENYSQDIAINGLQVACSDLNKEVKKIVFAVDACEAVINRAIQQKADVIIVHHGLFWGHQTAITGIHYKRIKKLLDNDIALYASHIPLDANEEVGNNYGLAYRIGLQNLKPFGMWRNMVIGVKGELSKVKTIDEVVSLLFPDKQIPLAVLPFGKKQIKTVGIISGGASDEVNYAIQDNLDLYITGEISHEKYHLCLETNMNYIAGGHYQTETIGVNLLKKKISEDTNIETVFIDVPTNL